MTIKDEICPRIKADARLMGDGTLWIKTDKLDKVGRVLVEHGTRCKQFYQDAQPERAKGHWTVASISTTVRGYFATCSVCGGSTFGGGKYCSKCGAKMEGEKNEIRT